MKIISGTNKTNFGLGIDESELGKKKKRTQKSPKKKMINGLF